MKTTVLLCLVSSLALAQAKPAAVAASGGSGTVSVTAPVTGDGSAGSPIAVPSASNSSAGLMTTGTQTLAGSKTFAGALTSGVAAGSNAITLTEGAYLDLGTGANDYFYSNGTQIVTPAQINMGYLNVAGSASIGSYMTANGGIASFVGFTSWGSSYFLSLDALGGKGVKIKQYTIATCDSSLEWSIAADAASGVATGSRSRMCMCTSNGSSTYAWQNIVSGTVGTSTTCAN